MKVDVQRGGSCRATVTLEVEDERVQPALRKAARRISREFQIPGFRKGRAPYHIVERAVGKEALYEESLMDLAPELMQEAFAENDIVPFAQPEVSIEKLEPFIMKLEVILPPQVDLGDYRSIRLAPEEVRVEDSDVEASLRQIQERQGVRVPVERTVEYGDQLVLDMEGHIGEETLFDVKETTFIPREEMSLPVPGFSEKLVGMTADGEEKEFTLTYPEDFPEADLARKELTCRVTLYEVRGWQLPPLDDELAMIVGDYDGLEDLKGKIRENLRARFEEEARLQLIDQAVSALVDNAEIEYPSLLVGEETEKMVSEQRERLRKQGLTLEGYLRMLKRSEEEFREELRPQAEERLMRSLVLREFVRAEGIEVGEEELGEEIEQIASLYGGQAEAVREGLSSEEPRDSLTSRLLAQKAITRLLEMVTGEEKEEPEEAGSGAEEGEEAAESEEGT